MHHPINRKSNEFLLAILLLQFIACITMFLDIPVARQVIGFIYLTFVPGIVLIKLLKMKMNGLAETLLFAAGLSVAFLMLIGLFVNQLHPLFDISKPLSLTFLLPAINTFVLVCAVIIYLRGENESYHTFSFRVENPLVVLLLCIPTLSIIGAIMSGVYGNNMILIFTIIAIATLFAVTMISKKAVSTKLYPFLVLIIATSLTYHSALVSEKMVSFGSDLAGEMFAQKIVDKSAYWNPVNPYPWDQSVGRIYAMLSVTMFPTIYSTLVNLDTLLVFKLFYSILLALVPLGLYNLWKNFLSEKFAFISVFFFMAFQPFYTELLGLNRQILGELFLVLLLTTILNSEKRRLQRTVCLIIFSFGLIVSHYALAEIFLFFNLFVIISSIITRKPSRKITSSFILTFFAIMFAWYLFTSSSAVYESFMSFGERIHNELGNFFSLQSREPEILRGLGIEPPPTIWNLLGRIFAYATEVLIVIGFINIILKRNKIYLDKDYFFMVFGSMIFLGALIVVPGLASTMNTTRFYHVLLFFLAPLCVLGAKIVASIFSRWKKEMMISFLLLTVLIPYFLFQVGFVYEVTGSDSWSVPLSKYRMSAYRLYSQIGYATAYSIFGAEWISNNVAIGHTQIYADSCGRVGDLKCYGAVYGGYVEVLSNVTGIKSNGVVYLNSLNVIEGIFVGSHYLWNTSEFGFLSDLNIVYSNGGCEIYKNSP
ncbi:MAG: DUF2206 domain-containing protein [Candidatus Bathyarchaeia archaeon]